MGLVDKWRGKLRETNDALAEARKSWRDAKLGEREQRASEREQSLVQRETEIALKLAEMRAIENRRLLRRLGTVLIAAVTGILGFGLGIGLSRASVSSDDVHAPAQAQQPTAQIESEDSDRSAAAGSSSNTGNSEAPPPAVSSPPHYSDPDQAARDGLYGTGGKFNVGTYCLDKERQGEATFEQCLGTAALLIRSQQKAP